MAKDAIVNDSLAAKFATEKDSPYTRWVAAEGLDIIAAHYIPDLRSVELKPWERRGGRVCSSTTRRPAPPTTATSARSPPAESWRRSGSCSRR
ncbi:hypothetical protein ACFQ1B_33150 [Streptomyces mexicanus]